MCHPSQKSGFGVLFGVLFWERVHFEIGGGGVGDGGRGGRRRRRRGGGEGGRGGRRGEGRGAVHHGAATAAARCQDIGHVRLGKELCADCG